MRYPLHSRSLLGLCVLTIVAATACSDDFPISNASSDYLVTLDVTPEHAGVNEELTLTCTVTHDGEPVSELDLELRYTHLGAGEHLASQKNMDGGPCDGAETGPEMGAGGDGATCEPGNHIEMMHGTDPGTYVGTHVFEEVGSYDIEVEFEGHEGLELHHLSLAIEGADAH